MNLYNATNEPANGARFRNCHGGDAILRTYQAWPRTVGNLHQTEHAVSCSDETSYRFDPHEKHPRSRESLWARTRALQGRSSTHLGIRLILVNNKMRFTPERIANASIPDPVRHCIDESCINRDVTRRTQASATRMLKTLSQILQLHRWLSPISPYDLPGLSKVFLVICEHDKVLKRGHGAARGEVNVGGLAAQFGWAIWRA